MALQGILEGEDMKTNPENLILGPKFMQKIIIVGDDEG